MPFRVRKKFEVERYDNYKKKKKSILINRDAIINERIALRKYLRNILSECFVIESLKFALGELALSTNGIIDVARIEVN